MKIIKLFNKIKDIRIRIRNKLETTWIVAKVTRIINYLWAAAKITVGIFSASYILCVSGLYSVSVGLSKEIFLYGKRKANDDVNLENIC